MTKSPSKSTPTIGFLTVVEPTTSLFIGGYLILNSRARPVEFHCTVPVKPNRAQQILYGATLRSYLCGQQIGQALLRQATRKAAIILTDVVEAMEVREVAQAPVLLVPNDPGPENSSDFVEFTLGDHIVKLSREDADARSSIQQSWNQHFEAIDLGEPFLRICEAIQEAQRDAAA